MKYLSTLLIALLASATLVACDVDEGPMERAGESVDQGVENTRDATEDAVNNVEDAVE